VKYRHVLYVPFVLSIWSLFCRHLRLLPEGKTNQSVRLDTHLNSVLNLKGSLDKWGGFEGGMKNNFLFLFGLEPLSLGPRPVSLLLPYTPEFGALCLAECGELSHF
jgi:hypothetical protein